MAGGVAEAAVVGPMAVEAVVVAEGEAEKTTHPTRTHPQRIRGLETISLRTGRT